MLNYLGVITVGGISVATGGDADAVGTVEDSARALGRKLAAAAADGFSDPGQEAEITGNREFFREIVKENRDFRPDEYERWVRMGWLS
jgi:hypothetical protein